MEEVFIFANPIAGRGQGRDVAVRIARSLEKRGLHARMFLQPSTTLSDEQLSTKSGAAPYAAITVGGDGTLRGAVERLLSFADNDPARVPPVLVVPLGTANLMSRHLGIDWDPRTLGDSVAATVKARRITHLDAARANDRLFLLMAGIGIDAMVVHELDRLRAGPIDVISYALPALLAIQRYDYPPLRVEIDGQLVWNGEPAMAFIGNAPEYGTGFPILTEARSDDGMLDLCILPCKSRTQVVHLLMAVATGDHARAEGVVYRKGRSIRVDSPRSVPVQIDGEAAGHTPLSIDLLPSRLPFIVPIQ